MSARCFLIEPLQKHGDTEKLLQEHGDVVYLFKTGESRPSVFDDRFADECAERLDDFRFNAETDYLVIGGSANAIAKLIVLLFDEYTAVREPKVRTLMFSPVQKQFIPITIG